MTRLSVYFAAMVGMAAIVPPECRAAQSELMAEYARSDLTIVDSRKEERTKFDPGKREAEMKAQRDFVSQAMSRPPEDFMHYTQAVKEKHSSLIAANGASRHSQEGIVNVPLGVTEVAMSGKKLWDLTLILLLFGVPAILIMTYWKNRRHPSVPPGSTRPR